jgi:hypothetical protein
VHSFTGGTKVLMADGSSKPISQVKVGDKIANAVPETGKTQVHAVTNVIVTHTDHDFVDLTIAAEHPQHNPAAGHQGGRTAATVTASDTVVTVGKITTTFHHPFYDITKAAFVDAQHLQPGDRLAQPDGATATILDVRLYHATQTTYDLTIGTLHTYYVLAGAAPVLVHNTNCPEPFLDNEGEGYIRGKHTQSGSKRDETKGVFDDDVDLFGLADAAADVEPMEQLNGNCARVCDAGRPIGNEAPGDGGMRTNVYTVISDRFGSVITMHPGVPR